jgi:glycosyltransferase involved in cell wall biosynthesis
LDKSELPLISVVIPCLNRAHFLSPTIDSILGQDYPHIECIVVDGGSKDGTLEVLRSYGEKIHWISEPDKGNSDAINKGWRLSHGEILAWLNADDLWEVPDSVQKVVSFFQQHPDVDLVYGDCGTIDVHGNITGMFYPPEWNLEHAVVYCDHVIHQAGAFARRSILEKVGWLNTSYIITDHDLWYRIGLAGTIRHIPEKLACVRLHPSFWFKKSHAVAQNCVDITEAFFQNENVPDTILKKKRRAMSNAHARGIVFAWFARQWFTFFACAFRAFIKDPTNAPFIFSRMREFISSSITNDRGWFRNVLAVLRFVFILFRMPVQILRRCFRVFRDNPSKM